MKMFVRNFHAGSGSGSG